MEQLAAVILALDAMMLSSLQTSALVFKLEASVIQGIRFLEAQAA